MYSLYNSLENYDFKDLKKIYFDKKPYPYLIIDNFLDTQYSIDLEKECRQTNTEINSSNNFTQKNKTSLNNLKIMPKKIVETCNFFHSADFLEFLTQITMIEGLIPDPYLEGGGLHRTCSGGFLKMHTDFNWNNKLKLYRRINVIYYLNSNYSPQWKGELLLSKSPNNERVENMKSIQPISNRLLLFNTNDFTFHGHPDPHQFPLDYPRTSLAFYYYTSNKPSKKENRRNKSSNTKYVPSKNEKINFEEVSIKSRVGYFLRRWTNLG